MSETSHLVAAGVHFVTALLWITLAWFPALVVFTRRPRSRLFLIVALVATATAVHYACHGIIELTPTELDGRLPGLHDALLLTITLSVIATTALFRHMVPLLPVRERVPSRRWLVLNYGLASLAVVLTLASGWFTTPLVVETLHTIVGAYCVGLLALALWELNQLARQGAYRWGTGALAQYRPADVWVLTVALFVMGPAIMWFMSQGTRTITSIWQLFLHTAMAWLLALPFLARIPGEVLPLFLLVTMLWGLAAAVWFGARAAATQLPPEQAQLVELLAVTALLVLLGPGRSWLRAALDRLLFRRGAEHRGALQPFVQSLSPELGTLECCRRVATELAGVFDLTGVAVVLDDGGFVTHGEGRFEALEPVLRRHAADIPRGTLLSIGFLELPIDVREALVEADVTWVSAITSPQRRWGHVLAVRPLLRRPLDPNDVAAIDAFLGQLGRVLDGVELLARAVAVERSLAHAEKLAAIGELAARIAHEIRNPVTAARSLAQQLAREPGAPFREEHGLILTELERVERQVAALLRFARRDEFRFQRVDVSELTRTAVDSFRARLEAESIDVETAIADDVVAHADGEKLRQVLLNLIENAIDALHGTPVPRRLQVAVTNGSGGATLRVTDSGPGVGADALPHLFEPFFSLKPHGTGLGLAIAKRTIDAHGGRIEAASSAGAGMTFRVELPPMLSGS